MPRTEARGNSCRSSQALNENTFFHKNMLLRFRLSHELTPASAGGPRKNPEQGLQPKVF